MAGNFWQSSHCHEWILTKQDILVKRKADLQFISEEEYSKIMIFFANFIQAMGKSIKLRQQVIATATVYFKRFYSRNSFKCVDPFLMTPTCIFLASKVEEYGPVSTSKLTTACNNLVKGEFSFAFKQQDYPYRMAHIYECEFILLEMMDCCLIVFQPYRPLIEYCSELNEEAILPLAWRIVNDSLRTDVALLYPPYLIALAAIHLACVIQQKDRQQWFAELSVDFDKILEITQTLLNLYNLWKDGYEERKEIHALIEKLPKPKLNPTTNTNNQQQQQRQ